MELNPFFSDLSNSIREILIWQIIFVKFSRDRTAMWPSALLRELSFVVKYVVEVSLQSVFKIRKC